MACLRSSFAFIAIALALLAFGFDRAAAQQTAARPNAPAASASDDQAIRAAGQAYAKAYNAGDAKALAALFTADAEYTDEFGNVFKGRAEIEKLFAGIFASSPGAKLEIEPESIRMLGNNVALENGVARATPAHGNPSMTNYSAVQVKQEGHWLIASVRDTKRVPASNEEYLKALEWLVGQWHAESSDEKLSVRVDWIPNKNFLLRSYSVEKGGKQVRSGTQIIGWDPRIDEITSWHFDSDGGFGEDRWYKRGNRWFIASVGVLRDGAETTATNIITPIDGNSFTWQSTQRAIGGAALPDTEAVKLTRSPAAK